MCLFLQAAGLTLLALGVYTAKYGTGVTARWDILHTLLTNPFNPTSD